jgi:hypothetical protein
MAPRRSSYANVVATLALFLALGGGTAWASHHWLLSSTKQIKPSVIKKLHGAKGATGPTGVSGASGSSGATGATGANLTAQTTLPSGESESGVFAGGSGDASGDFIPIQIEFTQPLAAALQTAKIINNSTTAGNGSTCPGLGHAAAGYLCLYDFTLTNAYAYGASAYDLQMPSPDPGEIYFFEGSGGVNYVQGLWTVTAP